MTRWHTFEPGIDSETARHAELQTRITQWWAAFAATTVEIERSFRGHSDLDLVDWMYRHLQAIDPDLMWEFGPGTLIGHRLVITPEVNRHLRPLVEAILASAPTLPGWSFHAWRPAETLAEAHAVVEARTGTRWQAAGCRVQAGAGNRVDITFTYPRAVLDGNLANNQSFVAAETLFGEEALDRWVGFIDSIASAPGDLRLDAAKREFDLVRQRIIEKQPKDLCLERSQQAGWTLWKLDPATADDYPAQTDLAIAKSMFPELWEAAHSPGVFHSRRFSPRETFCYLKVDGAEDIGDEGFADKAEIEDAVDAALVPAGLGCHIGGGTGLRYSYIDLALTDWRTAVPVLQRVLQRGRVPRRAWLLFFDSDFEREWVGIYPDTPEPPAHAVDLERE